MRALKSFSLGFGMVSVPVKLYSATDDKRKALPIHNYHTECKHRVKEPQYCDVCEKFVKGETEKGYELDAKTDKYVPITEDDYERLQLESLANIQVEAFIDEFDLDDTRIYKDSYFIAPDEVGAKAFCLFCQAMEEAHVIGIAKMTMRNQEHLVSLAPKNGLIVLQTLHWSDELRDGTELVAYATITDQEKAMALQLIKGMTKKDLDFSQYTDKWREAFVELVQAKMEGKVLDVPAPKPSQTEADLAKQLLASLNALSVS